MESQVGQNKSKLEGLIHYRSVSLCFSGAIDLITQNSLEEHMMR